MSDDKLKQIALLIKEQFPDQDYKKILGNLGLELLGPLPDYSTLERYDLSDVKKATVGYYTIPYYEKIPGYIEVLIIERNPKEPDGTIYLGLAGGYVHLGQGSTVGEQPKQGAKREFNEEVINGSGKPVIDLDFKRMDPINSFIDYKNPNCPVANNGFTYELTRSEHILLGDHCLRTKNDREKYIKLSNNEVYGMKFMPLNELVRSPKELFFYAHEFDAVLELAERIKGISNQR